MSVSHLIVLGLFIALGSVGLALMQSSLGVLWRSVEWLPSNPTGYPGAVNGKLRKS